MRRLMFLLLLCHAAGAVAELRISDAWLRAMPPGPPNSAAYMTLQNSGASPVAVVAVATPVADAVEIHESVQEDGLWRMRELEQLRLAPGETLSLSPGGRHLMVLGLRQRPVAGDSVSFQLTLDNGDMVQVQAVVRRDAAEPHQHH